MATKPKGKVLAKAKVAPKKKPAPKAPPKAPASAMDRFGIEAVVSAIKHGDPYQKIAEKAGCGKTTLIDWLAADPDRSARAREARSIAATSYDEQALQGINDAADPFELSRAKEAAQHLRWRASKVNPREYGDKVQVDATIGLKTVTDDALLGELGKFGIAARIGPRPEASDA